MNEVDRPIIPVKAALIDRAFKKFNVSSFADLGACWAVNGGYTFHALSQHKIVSAYLADARITPLTKNRAREFSQLTLRQGDFRSQEIVQSIGEVDAVIMFDILLHQANPDWDECLERYAPNCRVFVIYNQNYIAARKTVRLIDLGLEAYLDHTPYKGQGREDKVRGWFAKHDEIRTGSFYRGKERDFPGFWQWGITDGDLILKLDQFGFELEFMENYGGWPQIPNIENHGFVFAKRGA
jgi:hypothetical protein